jgi:hypothetical protein
MSGRTVDTLAVTTVDCHSPSFLMVLAYTDQKTLHMLLDQRSAGGHIAILLCFPILWFSSQFLGLICNYELTKLLWFVHLKGYPKA